jgi:hypothetical protein
MNCITEGKTPLGDPCVRIDPISLLQGDIKALLPYLQAFAETGTLEPLQEPPLQGDCEGKLERASELAFVLAKRIQELEELLKEWKKFGQAIYESKTSDMLLAETVQLLGEE